MNSQEREKIGFLCSFYHFEFFRDHFYPGVRNCASVW